MKILGCIIILSGFTGAGMYASVQLNKRIRQLKSLQKALLCMERQIDYELAPLYEAFLCTGERGEEPWGEFFSSIGNSLEHLRQETDLEEERNDTGRKERHVSGTQPCPEQIMGEELKKIKYFHPWEKDLKILASLGKNLGEADKVTQLAKIKMAREELSQAIVDAGEEQKGKGKLYQTLGFCMGMMGVILLW